MTLARSRDACEGFAAWNIAWNNSHENYVTYQ